MLLECLIFAVSLALLYWVLLKKDDHERLLGIYTQPGKWFYLKKALFFVFLKLRAYKRKQELKGRKENILIYSPVTEAGVKPSNGHASAGLGIKSHQYLRDMETQQILAADDLAIDCIYFNGLNSEGTYFLMRIARRPHRQAEIWLSINIVGVGFFQSPVHPDTMLYNVNGDEFNCGGLKFECLIPMKRWKITFNGLLRKGKFNVPTEVKPEELHHVRFSFIWSAFSNPFDFDVDIYPGRLADSIAREQWSREFFDKLKKSHQTHYEQWGELFGVAHVDGFEEKVIHMRGYRDHSYGVRDWHTFHRYAINFAYLEDGTAFHVDSISLPETMSLLQCGYLSKPDGNMYPVTWTDMDMLALGEDINPPDEYTFSFIADGKKYKVHTRTREEIIYYMHEDRRSVILEHVSEYDVNGVRGYGIFEFLYRCKDRLSNVTVPPEVPMLREPSVISENDLAALSLRFEERACTSARLVGGKGCQLAHLTQLNSLDFLVPKGFCLTIAAFERQLSHNPNLASVLEELHNVSTSHEVGDKLKSACDAAVELFQQTPVCLEVTDVIRSGLDALLGPAGTKPTSAVAVRSSARGEDGSELSAAGQMTTYLGLTEFQKVCEAVRNCWASHFDYPAVMYRRQHGQPIKSAAGVVIQQMAPCKAAGVLFTREPISGNPGIMILNANFGLGESVVSGEAEPDQITIRRTSNDELEIIKREIGAKKTQVAVSAGGGTEIIAADSNSLAAAVCCLSDKVILRLANVGIELEKLFGDPRDIEFGVDDKDRIYLLQARPITSLEYETEWQLLHEFDTGIATDSELHTTANIQEMMPGAMTPLTISFFQESIEQAGQLGHVDIGLQPSVHLPARFVSLSCSKAFINLTYVLGNYEGNSLVSDKRMAELSILGEILPDFPVSEVESYNGRKSFLGRLLVALRMMKGIYDGGKDVNVWIEKSKSLNFVERKHKSAQELYDHLSEEFPIMTRAWDFHIRRSMGSAVWSNVLMSIVSQRKTVWTCEHFSDVALMLSKCIDVYSADVPSALKKLAQSLQKSEHKEKFIALQPEDAIAWLKSSASGSAGKEFEEFLVKHGHRCVREAELREKSWSVDPSKVIQVVQSMMQTPINEEQEQSTENNPAAIDVLISQLKSPITAGGRMALKKLIPKAQRGVGEREHSKSLTVKIADAFKLGYTKLGSMMVQESRLPDEDLIYFLTHREIGQLLHTRSAKLVMRAQKRRQMLPKQMDLKFPRTSRGHAKPILSTEDQGDRNSVVVSKLTGMPVSQGVVTGFARVVTSLQEAAHIKNGEILIVPYTDVGWSPYFPMISGLATEIGGLLSHGAVVAREYGLPCVVNLANATACFKSGDRVVLNGTLGTLEKVEER